MPLDLMITSVIESFKEHLGLEINVDRNRSDFGSTTKGYYRPDFLCRMKNVLLFKGEEKVNADQLQTAINEPVDKFSMLDPILFGSIQFMICYAATGHKVCSRQDQIIPLRKVINITHIMVTV